MLDHKTVVIFSSGNALVSSPGGDKYWIRSEDGVTLTPCSLQQAAMMWREHEKEERATNEEVGGELFGSSSPAPKPLDTNQESSSPGWEGYSEWQKDLMVKLGLTPQDVDPLHTTSKITTR